MNNKPVCIVSDLDGTLSIIKNRSPYDEAKCEQDEVNEPVRRTLDMFDDNGSYQIILCSGRDSGRGLEPTKRWLEKHGISYDEIYMRAGGDNRKDSIVKKEFLDIIKSKYEILLWLDDRNQVVRMLRDNGVTVFQVAPRDF